MHHLNILNRKEKTGFFGWKQVQLNIITIVAKYVFDDVFLDVIFHKLKVLYLFVSLKLAKKWHLGLANIDKQFVKLYNNM